MKIVDDIKRAFELQAARTPGNIAVTDGERSLTYAELNGLANGIAIKLESERGRFIGLVCDHSIEMIAAILGILKSGHGYVPAEPDFPIERIRYIMSQAGVNTVLTQVRYAELFDKPVNLIPLDGFNSSIAQNPACAPASSTPAYVLYTSGTTGFPKGVVIEHGNVCHYARAFCHEFHPGPGDVMLQYSVCTFDIFVEEVFPILLSGGALAIPNLETKRSFNSLVEFMEANHVTIVSGFPYLLIDFNRLGRLPSSLRLLISGGDVLRYEYVDKILEKVQIYNTYGPSETTVCCSYFKCERQSSLPDGTFPVGYEVCQTQVKIMDEQLRPVDDGVTGEICIYGNGVGRGYLNELDETNSRFLIDGATGERFYRSGDLGFRREDGALIFKKRKDLQVMILGRRVEPLEVENVLCRCENVEQAAVTSNLDENGLAYLTAYIVPCGSIRLSAIKKQLSRYLPAYMLPEFYVAVKELPQALSGKNDKSALPIVLKEGRL